MRLHVLLCVALLLTCAANCQRKHFEIEMQLTDAGVTRAITAWTEDDVDSNGRIVTSTRPADFASNGLRAYGSPEVLPDGRERYSATFQSELPPDLAPDGLPNFGRVQVVRSPLGVTVIYLERMPGRTDLLEVAQAAQGAYDLLVDAWLAYAKDQAELRDEPERRDRLERYLRGPLRHDAQNFALTIWVDYKPDDDGASTNGFDENERLEARAAAFLLEHGYVATEDLIEPAALWTAVQRNVVRRLAKELGYSADALPPSLAGLSDGSLSIDEITTAGLRLLGKDKAGLSAPLEVMVGDVLATDVEGTVTWRNVTHPPMTNGAWDPAAGTIVWHADCRSGGKLPQILFARFTEPDTAFLKAHLGELGSEPIDVFHRWYAMLSPADRRQVDSFLAALSPGPGLGDELRRFDLSAPGARAAEPGEPESLPTGVQAILPTVAPPTP